MRITLRILQRRGVDQLSCFLISLMLCASAIQLVPSQFLPPVGVNATERSICSHESDACGRGGSV